MKQRRTIVILGAVAALLVLVVTGLAVYFIHAIEKERNRLMTKNATANRWKKPEEERPVVEPEPEKKQDEVVNPGVENPVVPD